VKLLHSDRQASRQIALKLADQLRHSESVIRVRRAYARLQPWNTRPAVVELRIPSYWMFDRRRFGSGPLAAPVGQALTGAHSWSADNRAELERGWIQQGTSVAEVAERVGLEDPAAAERTVRAHNDGCTRAEDEFGRPRESLVPLDSPPFYAIPLFPGASNTSGGPRRNERAQVLDPFGEPIPGLYGAGELGQAIAHLYPSPGASLSDALCFGRIEGEAAAE
jgi:hypothetical protein